MSALPEKKKRFCITCGEILWFYYNPPKRCCFCMNLLGENKMAEDCIMGVENKTRINNIKNDVDDIKNKELPAIRDCMGKKVSSVFVSIGVLVLAGLLAIIYNGQREISKDITTIKIEQSKVTSQFKIHESNFDRINSEIGSIKKKIKY